MEWNNADSYESWKKLMSLKGQVSLKKELNAACVVVTHQLSTIRRAVDYVIMLYHGNIVFNGSVEELLSGKNEYARQFVSASINGPMNIASR